MKKLLFILGLFYAALLNSAAPYVHLYLADQFLKHFPKDGQSKEQFILGNLFPDIRYLGVQSREDTHFEAMTLEEVLQEPSPFLAGMKFHSYVDIERDRIARKHDIYEALKSQDLPNDSAFLKLVEDEILFQPREEYREYLKIVCGEEFGISKNDIVKWHQILSRYLAVPPSAFLATLEKNNQGFLSFTKEEITEWNRFLKSTTVNKLIVEYIEDMLKHFDKESNRQKEKSKN